MLFPVVPINAIFLPSGDHDGTSANRTEWAAAGALPVEAQGSGESRGPAGGGGAPPVRPRRRALPSAPAGGVLDRVRDEIRYDLPQPAPVRAHEDGLGRQVEHDLVRSSPLGEQRSLVRDDRPEIDRLGGDRELALG